MRTHLKMVTIPLLEGRPYTAECGTEIRNAHLAYRWDAEAISMEGTNTLCFCGDCITAALNSPKGRRYIYGLSEAQEAKIDVDYPVNAITKMGAIDMQVCVPADYSDEEVVAFAEKHNPCGTTTGWQIRRTGDPALLGKNERVDCAEIKGRVHIMLDA